MMQRQAWFDCHDTSVLFREQLGKPAPRDRLIQNITTVLFDAAMSPLLWFPRNHFGTFDAVK